MVDRLYHTFVIKKQAEKQALKQLHSVHILPGSSSLPARSKPEAAQQVKYFLRKLQCSFSKVRLSAAPGQKSKTRTFLLFFLHLSNELKLACLFIANFLQSNKFGHRWIITKCRARAGWCVSSYHLPRRKGKHAIHRNWCIFASLVDRQADIKFDRWYLPSLRKRTT